MSDDVRFNVNLNATVILDKTTWDEFLEEAGGDEADALYELGQELESSLDLGFYQGEAWVSCVEDPTII